MPCYSMTVEPGVGEMWSMKILDEEGNLYRYFASITKDRSRLLKIKEYFDAGDISPIHIDDIICDLLSM